MGVEEERPSPYTFQLPLSPHSRSRLSGPSWSPPPVAMAAGRGGGDSWNQPPAPAAPANPPPALSLPSTGWAPSPAALGWEWGEGAGRWWPMRRGRGENLSQGLPSPISSSVSTTRFWKELGDGSWAQGGGGVLLAVESQGPAP